MEKERIKLERNVGGIKDMRNLPTVMFVVDPKKESIAVNEAKKLGITVVAITDTNCDPDGLDYVIPGNDDAIRSIRLLSHHVAEAVLAGKAQLDGEDASDEAVAAAMADAGNEMIKDEAAPEQQ
jgi:small subunit ribosomal protein S2